VILSNHASAEVLQRVPQEELGGWAYLLKRRTDDIAEVVHALYTTCAGDTMIDPTIIAESATPVRLAEALSAHQLRVLRLLAGGASNALIAEEVGASPKSVEHAISGILDQLAIDARDPTTNARVTAAVSYIRQLSATA
jgi:DNA-binding NarL/FixJ family response regulator